MLDPVSMALFSLLARVRGGSTCCWHYWRVVFVYGCFDFTAVVYLTGVLTDFVFFTRANAILLVGHGFAVGVDDRDLGGRQAFTGDCCRDRR